ncbi:unnamed protein product [Closterium sp. Yama58-4]|nr:unnamed protein product [Closterium sp. Yama58-4]
MADVAGPSYALGSVTNHQTDNQRSPPSKFPEPPLVEVSELTVELEAWEDDLLNLCDDEAGDIGGIREVVAPTAAPMGALELPAISAEFSGSLNQGSLETPSSPMLFSPFLPEDGLAAEGEGFLDGLTPLSSFHENEESPLAVPSDDLDELDAILFPSLPGSMASMASIASSSNLCSPAALPPPQHAAARRALDRLLADGGIVGKRARSARGSIWSCSSCGHGGTKNESGAKGIPLAVHEVREVGETGDVRDVGEGDCSRSGGRLLHVKREGGVAETLKFDRLELVESTLGPLVDRMGEPRNAVNGATAANDADVTTVANGAADCAANGAANGANNTPAATSGVDGRSNGGAARGTDDHLASRHPVVGSAAVVSPSNEKTTTCHCRVEEGGACPGRSEDSKGSDCRCSGNKRPWSSPLVAYLLSPPSPRSAKRRSLPVIPAPSPISQGNSPSGFFSPRMETSVFRLPAAATSSAPAATPSPSAAATAASADAPASSPAAVAGAFPSRRCSHCSTTTTPQWRTGPLGAKTLCNACGVRFKSGRLCPEYRPANSPGFSPKLHSNLHRKIVQMRERRGGEVDEGGEGDCRADDGAGTTRKLEVQGLRKVKKVKECVEGGTVEGLVGISGNMGVAVVQEKVQERVQDQERVQERLQERSEEEVSAISPAVTLAISTAINPATSPLSGRKHRKVDIVAARRADAQAAAMQHATALQSAGGVVEVQPHASSAASAADASGAAAGAAGAAAGAAGAAAGAAAAAGVAAAAAAAAGAAAAAAAAGAAAPAAGAAAASAAAGAGSAAGGVSADGAYNVAEECALPSGAAASLTDAVETRGGRMEKKKEDGPSIERSMVNVGGSGSASAAMVSLQRSCSSGAHLTTNFVAASA